MKNDMIKQMRAAQDRQAAAIRNKPCYDRISAEFDIEYRVAADLQEARKRKNLTQSQLADRMGTTQSVVSRIERGYNISIETLVRYAIACGARLDVRIAERSARAL